MGSITQERMTVMSDMMMRTETEQNQFLMSTMVDVVAWTAIRSDVIEYSNLRIGLISRKTLSRRLFPSTTPHTRETLPSHQTRPVRTQVSSHRATGRSRAEAAVATRDGPSRDVIWAATRAQVKATDLRLCSPDSEENEVKTVLLESRATSRETQSLRTINLQIILLQMSSMQSRRWNKRLDASMLGPPARSVTTRLCSKSRSAWFPCALI